MGAAEHQLQALRGTNLGGLVARRAADAEVPRPTQLCLTDGAPTNCQRIQDSKRELSVPLSAGRGVTDKTCGPKHKEEKLGVWAECLNQESIRLRQQQ